MKIGGCARESQPQIQTFSFQFIFCFMPFNAFWEILRLGNLAWDFLGVNFWSRDFFGFDGSAGDYFRFWFLPPLDHPCHMKAGVPYLGKILTCFWGFMVIFPYWMELREIKMESWKILSLTPRRDVRIYSNTLNVGYIFIEGVEVGGWVILMFFLGGGAKCEREEIAIYRVSRF